MIAIDIKNLSKNYSTVAAVKNLSLTIPKGKIVGFVGKNGAGKSTTLRSIFGMIHQTSGKITVLGMDSANESKAIKSKVAYVPGETSFYDNITCEKLLKFALGFTQTPMQEIERLAHYYELDLKKKVNELSLGNHKKVLLIQGFLKDAEILVFDEPTSGLDPLMQNKFFEHLLLEKQQGKTIFLSSHNLAEIEKYCDMVAIIKDGELVDFFDMADVKIKHSQQVSYTTADGKSESFELKGDINELISELSKLNLSHLEIKTKSVEDEFIGYYGEG